ncbi:MAG: sulfatase, partial [Isosphaeraceae bacterium]
TRVLTQESRAVASLPTPSPDAPNVLLLVLDNVRAESMSLYGHDRPTTPNLDRLARRGTVFNEARSTSSWTLPSHASLMTGRWCNELNFGFNRALDAAHPTLAEFLSRAGYVTAGFVGNTYYANAIYGLSRGFSRYEDHYENLQISLFEVIRSGGLGKRVLHFLGYPIHVEEGASIRKTAAMLNRDLLSWIDNRPEDRPFFGFVNYFDAHAPFLPPRGFETRFGMAALPTSEKARILKRSVRLGTNPATPGENADEIRLQAQAIARDSYESCLAYLDQEIGRLMDALDRRGLSEKTLIVITSDHGEHFGERGFSGHGRSLYRPEVHVPLLVLWPRDRADRMAQVVDQPVTNREVPTTVADLLDLGATSPFSGSSLARFRRAAPAPEQTPVLSELDHQRDLQPMREVPASLGPVKALIRDGKVYMQVGTDHEELYDLETDPREMRNLLSTVDGDRSVNPTHVLVRSHRTLLGRLTGEQPPTEIAEDSPTRLRR